MIDSVIPIHVVSNYQRTTQVGDNIVVSHIQHVKVNGTTIVEEVRYVSYNAQGQKIEQPKQIGTTVDITV